MKSFNNIVPLLLAMLAMIPTQASATSPTTIPEPGVTSLLAISGILALITYIRRKK